MLRFSNIIHEYGLCVLALGYSVNLLGVSGDIRLSCIQAFTIIQFSQYNLQTCCTHNSPH